MWWSKQKWNDAHSPEKASYGGFSDEADKIPDCEREAAETALCEGVRACEEELPFN